MSTTAAVLLTVLLFLSVCVLGLYVGITLYSCRGRETHRWRSFYEPGYHTKMMKSNEPPFEITSTYNVRETDKKIISLSLYGTHDKYFNGCLALVDECAVKLPGWIVRVYLHDQVPGQWMGELVKKGCEVFVVHDECVVPGNSAGAFWRFMPVCDPNVTFIALDVDEPLVEGLVEHVNLWLNMPDYPYFRYCVGVGGAQSNIVWPKYHLVAGKFGRKAGVSDTAERTITHYAHRSTFGSDEVFLYDIVSKRAVEAGLYTAYRTNTHKRMASMSLWPDQMKFNIENKKEHVCVL